MVGISTLFEFWKRFKKMKNFTITIEKYDSKANLYFKSVTNEDTKNEDKNSSMFSKIAPKSIKTVNIAIVDTILDTHTLLFDEQESVNISFLLFELDYNDEKKSMEFEDRFSWIMNNENIEEREPRDRLLIGLNVEDKIEIWMSNKRGKSLEKVVTIEKNEKWHLDVKNCKIRVISSVNSNFFIKNFEW